MVTVSSVPRDGVLRHCDTPIGVRSAVRAVTHCHLGASRLRRVRTELPCEQGHRQCGRREQGSPNFRRTRIRAKRVRKHLMICPPETPSFTALGIYRLSIRVSSCPETVCFNPTSAAALLKPNEERPAPLRCLIRRGCRLQSSTSRFWNHRLAFLHRR